MREMYKRAVMIAAASFFHEAGILRGEELDDFITGKIVESEVIAEPSKAVLEGIDAIQSVKESVSMAQSYAEEGFRKEEELYSVGGMRGKENFTLARKCFSHADELLKKDEVALFLKWGWFMYRTQSDKADRRKAIEMLEQAMALEPDNPEACFKVAYVKIKAYYDVFSEEQYVPPVKLPDGSYRITQVRYYYSKERDNRDLDEAEKLLKKAIKSDGAFADAYWLLASKIYAHKEEVELAILNYRLFLKHVGNAKPELHFYDAAIIADMIPAAESYLRVHASDKPHGKEVSSPEKARRKWPTPEPSVIIRRIAPEKK